MSKEEHKLAASDILPIAKYGSQRAEQRKKMSAFKKNRRVAVGPAMIQLKSTIRTPSRGSLPIGGSNRS